MFTDSVKSAAKLSKKSTATKRKKVLQTIPLDITGRPKFPIKLGDLTVHSLGEVCCGLVLNILLSFCAMFTDKELMCVLTEDANHLFYSVQLGTFYANDECVVLKEV